MEGQPKGYEIFGKSFTPREEQRAREHLEGERRAALKPLEGELPKTSEELKFIEKLNEYLQEEFEELGISEKPPISPEEIHLLPQDVYAREFPRETTPAKSNPHTRVAYLNKDWYEHKPELYADIVHESLHIASATTYQKKEGQTAPLAYRSGYAAFHPSERAHEHFRGLDEAVIERFILDDIWGKHKDELISELNLSDKEVREFRRPYAGEVKTLDTITRKIAEENGEEEGEVWQRFKRGLFTGDLMHLRDVERTFGKGSVRVLGAFDSGTKDLPQKEINEKILKFFKTEDEEEKERIAKEVLIERERLRYEKRRSE